MTLDRNDDVALGDSSLSPSHSKYRPDIDGLRAIAVLSVVAYHAAPSILRGGFIGVDIFFVISGFLITRIILENMRDENFSLASFYSRRINRLFPALAIVLITTYIIGWSILFADEYKMLGKHIAAGAAFVSNITLIKEAGYFDTSADTKPLLHLWSLGIEEQFYLIWPALLWLAWKTRTPTIAAIAVAATVSLYLNLKGIKKDPTFTFFSPQTRFWELACGSLLAWLHLRTSTPPATIKNNIVDQITKRGALLLNRNLASLTGLALITYGLLHINHNLSFPGKWALIPVLGAILIIAAGPDAWINRHLLSNRLAVWFGLISFPLYLWHWPLLTFLRISQGGESSALTRASVVILSILLAWLTYRFVETPVRRNQHKRGQTAVLVAMVAAMGGLGYYSYIEGGFPERSIAKKSKDFDYTGEVPGYAACDQATQTDPRKKLNYCLTPISGEADAIVIGDSHAEDKIIGLATMDKSRKWMLMGNSSCPPTLGLTVEGDQKNCAIKFEDILTQISSNKKIGHVALAFFGNYFLTTAYAADHVQNHTGPQSFKIESQENPKLPREEAFYTGLDKSIKYLTDHGKHVTLLIDIPELPFFPKDCIRNTLNNCTVPRADVDRRQASLRRIISRLKAANPSIDVHDPIDLMCDTEQCSYAREHVILYRDSHHLSVRGSLDYARQFLSAQSAHKFNGGHRSQK